jgi:hypothetical protein
MDILQNISQLGPEQEKFVQFSTLKENIQSDKILQLSL